MFETDLTENPLFIDYKTESTFQELDRSLTMHAESLVNTGSKDQEAAH